MTKRNNKLRNREYLDRIETFSLEYIDREIENTEYIESHETESHETR